MARKLRILQVAAEVHPLLKTGGLADVTGALPDALHALGHDVRVLMPGYSAALDHARTAGDVTPVCQWTDGRLLTTRLPGGCPVWLYETPGFAIRGERPYDRPDGTPWPDNADRFDEFARVTAALADDALGLGWRPDVVNLHDWHTGLAPVYMTLARVPAATVFTVHNLAHQGLFELEAADRLGLPGWLQHWQALEYGGLLSFIKGGIGFADLVSTVSPFYAREITTPAFGEGLDGLLAARGDDLVGIVNGIDTDAWDPARDPHAAAHYSADDPEGKIAARRALLEETALRIGPQTPVVACIGRLGDQKGTDVLLEALDGLLALPVAVVVLGSGDPAMEAALGDAARRHPEQVHVTVGFDEAFAHRIYAGADMLVMPSRFEPCGLSQLNAMRYGTIPVVQRTGGLAETVSDADAAALTNDVATGFVFDGAEPDALVDAVARARGRYLDAPAWRALVASAMRRDSSWTRSAQAYAALYEEAIPHRLRHLGLRMPGAGAEPTTGTDEPGLTHPAP